MKLLVVNAMPRLCLFALTDIQVDEQIRYHYGAGHFPWRKKKQVCILNVTLSDLMRYCYVQVIFK